MMGSRPRTTRVIYFLQPVDELRHPYESALKGLCPKVIWLNDYEELIKKSEEAPHGTAIIDLDCLAEPVHDKIQNIATAYSGCALIALSSSDSSQLALKCLRAGYSDYLLKPTSPEELAWAVRKANQHHEFLERFEPNNPKAVLIRTVTQISSCNIPALVRIYTLDFMQKYLKSKGAAWVKLDEMGLGVAEILGSTPKSIAAKEYLPLLPFPQLQKSQEETLTGKTKKSYVIYRAQEDPRSLVFAWGIEGNPSSRAVGEARIIFEHAELSLLNIRKVEELKQQTFVDDLTGLYNSRFLKYAVTNAILRCKDPNQKFSVLFIDIDHFKSVNDKNGHLIGSEFLVTIGKTIRNAVRGIDPVFRYGGDEFVVVLHDTGTEGAIEIAERIRKNIERRIFVIQGVKLRSTVSIGIATYPEHAKERDTLLKLADEAMYSVKRHSRNAVHLAIGVDDPPKKIRQAA